MRVSMNGPMGGMNEGGPMGMASGEAENFLLAFFHKLPMWAQGIIFAAIVILAAWIVGIVIGKLYASCKYPDPEKQTIINPRLKIGLMAIIVACGFWVYSSFTAPPKEVMEVSNPDGIVSEDENPDEQITDEESPDGENDEDNADSDDSLDAESNDESDAPVSNPSTITETEVSVVKN